METQVEKVGLAKAKREREKEEKVKVKKLMEEWEIWDKKAKSEEEVKKMVLEHFYK